MRSDGPQTSKVIHAPQAQVAVRARGDERGWTAESELLDWGRVALQLSETGATSNQFYFPSI